MTCSSELEGEAGLVVLNHRAGFLPRAGKRLGTLSARSMARIATRPQKGLCLHNRQESMQEVRLNGEEGRSPRS